MYRAYYHLVEKPFNVTADPHFHYLSRSHSEAYLSLKYGIADRKGMMVMIGEVGTGKTLLCRLLLKNSEKHTKIITLPNYHFESTLDLLTLVAFQLGIYSHEYNKTGLIRKLQERLIKRAKKKHATVLLIDEAQHLHVQQLEQIRLLSNLETEKEKLVQIILVGQPELDEKLKLQSLRQLRQRIAIHLYLEPLEFPDVKMYVHHRIQKAMRKPKKSENIQNIIFTENALSALYHFSKGTPRTINLLCDRALLSGFVLDTHLIDESIIENCAREVVL